MSTNVSYTITIGKKLARHLAAKDPGRSWQNRIWELIRVDTADVHKTAESQRLQDKFHSELPYPR